LQKLSSLVKERDFASPLPPKRQELLAEQSAADERLRRLLWCRHEKATF